MLRLSLTKQMFFPTVKSGTSWYIYLLSHCHSVRHRTVHHHWGSERWLSPGGSARLMYESPKPACEPCSPSPQACSRESEKQHELKSEVLLNLLKNKDGSIFTVIPQWRLQDERTTLSFTFDPTREVKDLYINILNWGTKGKGMKLSLDLFCSLEISSSFDFVAINNYIFMLDWNV